MKTHFLIMALALVAACSSTEKDMMPSAADGIAASNAQFEAAFNGGNAAGVAALYTEDATLLPPGAAAAQGRTGAQALWQGYVDAKLAGLKLIPVSLDDQGDTATELGRWAVDVPDGKGGMMTVSGNYVVLWKRGADGVWRLKWDIWNDDAAG